MKRIVLVGGAILAVVVLVAIVGTTVMAATPTGDARITFPYDGTQVTGTIQIKGTVGITDPQFSFYKLEFGLGDNPPGFGAVSGVKSSLPSGDVLDTWDTRQFPDGAVQLKLTVVDNTGNYLTDQIRVIINNHPVTVGAAACGACHTKTYAAWQATMHGKTGITCEACHGPGGTHVATGGNVAFMGAPFASGQCGTCHKDLFAQWSTSKHTVLTEGPVINEEVPCNTCHTGQGFVAAQIDGGKYTPVEHPEPATCATCHNPHSAANTAQLRAVGTKTVVSGTTKNWGLGAQCAMCHNERRTATDRSNQVNKSFGRGPHEGTSADMLAGTGAWEFAGFTYTSSAHTAVATNACVTCHVTQTGNHTFAPQLSACKTCHAGATSFDLTAKGDYDGNGKVEAVQDEVAGLMTVLAAQLPPQPWTNNKALDTVAKRGAAYNFLFVENDRSEGVHNTMYAVQLLQSSYKAVTGKDVPGATIVAK